MTANKSPIFVLAPRVGIAQISTANAYRDGSGEIQNVFFAGQNGSRIHRISVKAVNNVAAGMVRIFLANEVLTYLYAEILVKAVTPSPTVKSFEYNLFMPSESAIILPYGWAVKASTALGTTATIGNIFNVFVEGGDY